MADPDYGLTFRAGTDLDPTLRIISGPSAMALLCLRRLYTPAGTLPSDPNAITVDVRTFLSKGMRSGDVGIIQAQCVQALLDDERIFDVTVVAALDPSFSSLTLTIHGTGAEGPFSLTLGVTSLTVEILRST